MAPTAPRTVTAGQNPLVWFDKSLKMEFLTPPPGRAFLFRLTFNLDHPRQKAIRAAGIRPLVHWHPDQNEWFKVHSGTLTVEAEGKQIELTPESEELMLVAGTNHRLYPTPRLAQGTLIADVSASDSGRPFQLDRAFFENWYAYQDEVMRAGGKLDFIQLLNSFDAADSYVTPPWWVPFPKTVSYWTGVIVGRWIGSLLGYRPYHPEWTSDWAEACGKMETSIFQRRFATRDQAEAIRRNVAVKKGD